MRLRAAFVLTLVLGTTGPGGARPSFGDDTIAPSTPSGFAGSAVACSRIDLAWAPSVDQGGNGLRGYKLYRNGYYVALVLAPATSTGQVPLAASTTYSYAVSAIDGAGNESPQSAAISITTPACPDRTAPTPPMGLTAAASASCSRIDLAWDPATDVGGSGLQGYRMYRDGVLAQELPASTTFWSDTDLAPATTHSYAVSAVDNTGNESAPSLTASSTTSNCAETTAPGVPTGLTATAVTCGQIDVSWMPATDPAASPAIGFDVYRNGLFLARLAASATATIDTGLSASTTYTYTVVAIDAAGNRSAETAPAGATTPACPDTMRPTAPSNLTAATSSCTQIELSWGPSTDFGGTGLRAYRIYRNGIYVRRILPPATSASDGDLTPSTTYSYTVAAVDYASNRSAQSNVATATTRSCANQAPVADAGPDQVTATLTPVAFSGAGSADPDGTIQSYGWSFGDGASASGITAAHAYATAGSYTVTLTVTDDAGQIATDTATIRVSNRTPVASAGPNRTAKSGESLTFDGTRSYDSDGRIVTYAWSFGDGISASGVSVTHAYARPGTYLVTLTVTDDSASIATDTATARIVNRAPVAKAGPDQAATSGTPITLDGSGSSDADGRIVAYAWTFGDGITADGPVVSHGYAAGTYTATLIVTDDLGASASDTALITITTPVPVADTPWAQRIGGPGYDEAKGVAVDADGNIFVTGEASGPFDLGAGWVCADSIFIAKYAPTGALLWAHCLGSDGGGGSGQAVAVDGNGDVAVTGYFRGTVDFGGGPLVSPDGFDVFLAKFSAQGEYLWAQRFGSPIVGALVTESGKGLAIDGSGNIAVIGIFEGTVDFGGGPLTSAGQSDIFLAKFSPAGTHLWSRRFGGTYGDTGDAVAVDADGSVLVTGTFLGTVDFGGGPLSSPSYDVFVAKYSPAGAHLWSQHFGGTLSDEGRAIAVDHHGNVLVTGTFTNIASFGGAPLTSAGGNDVFLAKYSAAGEHLWSQSFGSLTTFDAGTALAVDRNDDVVVTGYFARAVDFGSGLLTSAGSKDIFVAKYSAAGAPQWALRYGGTSIDAGDAVAVDAKGNVVVAGAFYGSVDFGAGPLTSAGAADAFLLRLVP